MLLLVFGVSALLLSRSTTYAIVASYEDHGSTYIALGIMLLLSWCVLCVTTPTTTRVLSILMILHLSRPHDHDLWVLDGLC